jgi:hypothetical protein
VHEFKTPKNIFNPNSRLGKKPDEYDTFTNSVSFDEEKGLFYGLFNDYYIEIDINNPFENSSRYYLGESMKKHGVEVPIFTYSNIFFPNYREDLLLFATLRPGDKKYGIFNRNTHEIIWYSNQLEENGVIPLAIYRMMLKDNKAYILDSERTLRIYEHDF